MPTTPAARWPARPWDHPLIWALPLQALLLFYNLNLLEPWRDEWFTLQTVPRSLSQINVWTSSVGHPPLYFLLLHYWIELPIPASEIWKLRAMSVLWAIAATVALYYLWLRRETRWTQRIVLGLWILSPCMLLYSRMARSYSMQLTVALLLLSAALRWIESPRSASRLLIYGGLAAAMLYVHYLPGLAIFGATAAVFIFRRQPPIRQRLILLGLAMLATLILCLPGLDSMVSAIQLWRHSEAIAHGRVIVGQFLRLAWWFVSFSFGESLSTTAVVLGLILSPIFLYALYRGIEAGRNWASLVGLAALLGYIGVERWTGFPFVPARELFVLPFFLMLMATGMRRMRYGTAIFGMIIVLYAIADLDYFTRTGFLNKEYCAPYRQIALDISRNSPPGGAVLLVDEYSTFSLPLAAHLAPNIPTISLENEESPAALAIEKDPPPVIWMLRHGNYSPVNEWVSDLESRLRQARKTTERGYLPYSEPERWILAALRGPNQPRDFFTLIKFSNPSVESDSSEIHH